MASSWWPYRPEYYYLFTNKFETVDDLWCKLKSIAVSHRGEDLFDWLICANHSAPHPNITDLANRLWGLKSGRQFIKSPTNWQHWFTQIHRSVYNDNDYDEIVLPHYSLGYRLITFRSSSAVSSTASSRKLLVISTSCSRPGSRNQ